MDQPKTSTSLPFYQDLSSLVGCSSKRLKPSLSLSLSHQKTNGNARILRIFPWRLPLRTRVSLTCARFVKLALQSSTFLTSAITAEYARPVSALTVRSSAGFQKLMVRCTQCASSATFSSLIVISCNCTTKLSLAEKS